MGTGLVGLLFTAKRHHLCFYTGTAASKSPTLIAGDCILAIKYWSHLSAVYNIVGEYN